MMAKRIFWIYAAMLCLGVFFTACEKDDSQLSDLSSLAELGEEEYFTLSKEDSDAMLNVELPATIDDLVSESVISMEGLEQGCHGHEGCNEDNHNHAETLPNVKLPTSIDEEIISNTAFSSSQNFVLNSNGVSHIHWPFPNTSYYYNSSGCSCRSQWYVCHGSIYHKGGDYYADDYNFSCSASGDCGKQFNAPMSGKVIYAGYVNGYGNHVVIQSNSDSDFAFRVAHLQSISVSTDQNVQVGTKLGLVGKTGTPSCHAHVVLYKNIYQTYSGSTKGIDRLKQGLSLNLSGGANTFAARFYMDVAGGSSGGGSSSCAKPTTSQTYANSITTNSAYLQNSRSGVQYYDWAYKKTSSSSWINLQHTTTNYRKITGLSPNTTYQYSMRVYCNGRWSDWSTTETFRTQGSGGG